MAHSSGAPLYISLDQVCQLVTMADIIEVTGRALEDYSKGEDEGGVVQPVRTVVPVKPHNGYLFVMPGFSKNADALATKLVSVYPDLPESHIATVLLFDATTGKLNALIDGTALTVLRTAAASACGVKALLPKPPSILCIVGSGEQARGHVEAMRVCHNYSEVRIWGRNKERAEKCAADVGGGAVVFESLEKAVKDADVICTVTMATEPVLFGKWLKPGAVVCCVGACRPDWRELDDELMLNSVVVVDSRAGACKESGDIILSKAEVFAEVGEIISGSKILPRVPDCGKKFLLFKSLGMAVEDVVSGKLVYDRYLEKVKQKAKM